MFVFVKQKTSYEMRISDWSSDVCSSDLRRARRVVAAVSRLGDRRPGEGGARPASAAAHARAGQGAEALPGVALSRHSRPGAAAAAGDDMSAFPRMARLYRRPEAFATKFYRRLVPLVSRRPHRSEEPQSELPSPIP